MTLDDLAAAVLGAGTDGFATRSFIDLGGDSLRAMRFAAAAQEELGVRVPLKALLGAGPLAAALAQAQAIPPGAATAPARSGRPEAS